MMEKYDVDSYIFNEVNKCKTYLHWENKQSAYMHTARACLKGHKNGEAGGRQWSSYLKLLNSGSVSELILLSDSWSSDEGVETFWNRNIFCNYSSNWKEKFIFVTEKANPFWVSWIQMLRPLIWLVIFMKILCPQYNLLQIH